MRFIRWISLLAIAASFVIGSPTCRPRPRLNKEPAKSVCCAFRILNGDGTYTSPDEPLLANVNFHLVANETGESAELRPTARKQ